MLFWRINFGDTDLQIESEAFDADLNVLMDEIESNPPVEGFP